MTKVSRIRNEVRAAVAQEALGPARTARLAQIKATYGIGEGRLRALCLFGSGLWYWL